LVTVVVAPIFAAKELAPIKALRPTVKVQGRLYIVAIDRLTALDRCELEPPLANLEGQSFEIKRALELVFSGF
jgi:CcdB protein